jgi:hypothetical protein
MKSALSAAHPINPVDEEENSRMPYFFTKTNKTLTVMQGLRPLAPRRHRLARSKLRQADAVRRQPSFLRLASQ